MEEIEIVLLLIRKDMSNTAYSTHPQFLIYKVRKQNLRAMVEKSGIFGTPKDFSAFVKCYF